MSFLFSLKIPITPEPWRRARSHGKIHFKDSKSRAYQDQIARACARWLMGGSPFKGPLKVTLKFEFARPKSGEGAKRAYPHVRPDLDNLLKAILDALNLILWEDDAQVVDCHCVKAYGEPGVTVSVWAL